MPTTTKKADLSAVKVNPLVPPPIWRRLAEAVRSYDPDVCVVVARKMPRLLQVFKLDFGRSLIISDFAIPFCRDYIRGARVAIIDDLINVGSTMAHAQQCVVASGASDYKLFAIGKRTSSRDLHGHVQLVFPEPLSSEAYNSIVSEVPKYLMSLAKPYDLEFPIIPCRYSAPITSSGQLLAVLQERIPLERIHDFGACSCFPWLHRITVDYPTEDGTNCKLRFYCDDSTFSCNVTPFVIHSRLDTFLASTPSAFQKPILDHLVRALALAPEQVDLWPYESTLRVRMFTQSWEFGLSAIDEFADVLSLKSVDTISIADAALLLGPDATSVLRDSANLLLDGPKSDYSLPRTDDGYTSTLITKLDEQMQGTFVDRVRKAANSRHEPTLFRAVFEVISQLVGAENEELYQIEWPFTRQQVLQNPVLRLKVGPTFCDLVEIMSELLPNAADQPIQNLVSTLLDVTIDTGEVVPTLSCYDNHFVRIYRKGESKERDSMVDRMLYALKCYGKPLSMTRMSKVAAVLAFSAEYEDALWPSTAERGNVATLRKKALDLEGPSIAEYLRDIGEIKQIN